MEIDKAVRESDDRRLKNKYSKAIYIIQRALALYSIEEVAFSFNGGKDSTVLLHLLRAGHYLSQVNQSFSNGNMEGFPIMTIYFESSSVFPEINSFTHNTASMYGLQMEVIHTDFKSGLEALIKTKSIRAIFLGVRIGDPTAVGQEQFSPSSPGWPPFMRVNPILDWSYRDVWAFLLLCKVPYCCLYDQGYTSVGSIHDTLPNALLQIGDSACSEEKFRPAYMLSDGRLERAGRVKKFPSAAQLHPSVDGQNRLNDSVVLTTSVISVGDEILSGTVDDDLAPLLFRKLHSIGWLVSQSVTVQNSIDSIAEEVERLKSANDMVFLYGGVGPLHSDVTLGGVAKSFGVRLVPDEDFEGYFLQLLGDHCKGDRNEVVLLPEGITEILHDDKLPLPLIKCQNVIILTATNVTELDQQLNCLIDWMESHGQFVEGEPFVSKHLTTNISDVEVAEPLSKLSLEFPDICIGGYRKSRHGPAFVSFRSKDKARIDSAIGVLREKVHLKEISEID